MTIELSFRNTFFFLLIYHNSYTESRKLWGEGGGGALVITGGKSRHYRYEKILLDNVLIFS